MIKSGYIGKVKLIPSLESIHIHFFESSDGKKRIEIACSPKSHNQLIELFKYEMSELRKRKSNL